MSTSNKKIIREFVELGNNVRGHRVTGANRSETKKNVSRVFANARRRIEKINCMG